ncbi:Asparagine synthetase [glutamine-hydrolyzing] 3 [bioreactor metagenome]|uniref:Asparagine synthetase [glutamine-hydrolyzing] 3 n=1 Tax=bioreactor metagenome TaxID=1076179 RepID=A0A645F5Z1_9ZZZZ
MCGIAGFFDAYADYNTNRGWAKETIENMNRQLVHRGPDDNGIYISKTFALGHNRLSIIDLSSGQQPMIRSINGKAFGIVYNGEIYNMDEL